MKIWQYLPKLSSNEKGSSFLTHSVWDFTCPDTFDFSHLARVVTGPGAVANEAETKKVTKYSQLSATYFFVPVAIETTRALGVEAADFVREVGRRIAAASLPTDEQRATDFLLQRLSVAVQRGNVACVLGCANDGTDSDFIHSNFILIFMLLNGVLNT